MEENESVNVEVEAEEEHSEITLGNPEETEVEVTVETPEEVETEVETETKGKKEKVGHLKDALRQVESFGHVLSEALQGRGNVVMVRVNDDALQHLDMLIEAEITKSRSESAAFLISEGIRANEALFGKIRSITEQITELREQLRQEVKLETAAEPAEEAAPESTFSEGEETA